MKICYMGGQTAGVIGLLATKAIGHKVLSVVSYSEDLSLTAENMDLCVYNSVQDRGFVNDVLNCDILLSVHGREIIKKNIFELPKIASLNVHPFLYHYKGSDPIRRAIKDKNWNASVGCHHITDIVDGGEVVEELFVKILPSDNPCDVYSQLYPYYSIVVIKSLNSLESGYFGTYLTDFKG